jgi:hypothetical protein
VITVRHILLGTAIVALYALHQDVWVWRTAHPLVFGFLPIGLAYHGAYCVAATALMWALTTYAWPSHLEEVTSLRRPGEEAAAAGEGFGAIQHRGKEKPRR